MLELPSHAISDRHARGLRRDSERRIRDRRQSYRLERRPRKFGPRVRMVHELLYGTLGPGRVMMIEGTKRFENVNPNGHSQMVLTELAALQKR